MNRRLLLKLVVAAFASLPLALPAVAAEKVTVFAAASLKNALDAANAAWSKDSGNETTVSYAASSALAKQIEAAAPADLFISADLAWMDYVAEKKLIKDDTRVNLLGNRIVLVAPKDKASTVMIKEGFDLAGLVGDGKLAMGAVETVPAGKYGKAALEKSSDGWLDLMMRLFSRALADQLRRGLIRRYREEADDLPTVRGRLQIEEQVRRNLVHRERSACAYDEFDEDHALNQLFRVAIRRMLRVASNNTTQQALRELLPAFEGVSDVAPTADWLDRVTLDRVSERFGLCLGMARLFLRGATTGLYAGDQNSFALLLAFEAQWNGKPG